MTVDCRACSFGSLRLQYVQGLCISTTVLRLYSQKGYYFLTLKRKCKQRADIAASPVTNTNYGYNISIDPYGIDLYLETGRGHLKY